MTHDGADTMTDYTEHIDRLNALPMRIRILVNDPAENARLVEVAKHHSAAAAGGSSESEAWLRRWLPIVRIAETETERRETALARYHAILRSMTAERWSANAPRNVRRMTWDTWTDHSADAAHAATVAREWADQCTDDVGYPVLVMLGGVGVGKSHLASALTHQLAATGLAPVWLDAARWLESYATSRSHGGDRAEADREMEAAIGAGVLVLDDLGRQSGTAAELRALQRLVEERIERDGRPTIITTNATRLRGLCGHRPADATQVERIASRIQGAMRGIRMPEGMRDYRGAERREVTR